MTGVMGHCDDIDHLGIVMKGILEHCDDWGHETLLSNFSWIIVMTLIMQHCVDKGMDYCDDNGHGAM